VTFTDCVKVLLWGFLRFGHVPTLMQIIILAIMAMVEATKISRAMVDSLQYIVGMTRLDVYQSCLYFF
jgi:hypothetical protein